VTAEAQEADFSADTSARITEEHIERARLLLGYDEASALHQQITVAHADNIRAFALSYGDDNPLHCDPDYARRTRWGDVIAPGTMSIVMGAPLRGDPRPEAIARAKRHLFQGIHPFHSATEFEWYEPIRPGDAIYRFGGQEKLEVKTSEFGGHTVLRTTRDVIMNQHAQVKGVHRQLLILAERATATKRAKYMDIQPGRYSDEDIAAIDAIYAAEMVRGAEPRYWEDVAIGDSMGVMAKGPLTVTDIICMHTTGFAVSPFGLATSRVAYKRRRNMPRAFIKNSQGIPDTVIRIHWEDEWARQIGSPMAYDYGYMRECWLYHYLTDWCGDDGVVLRVRSEIRKFNYLGDVTTISGQVVDKHERDGRATIEATIGMVNQRGETTMKAVATIALPSRSHGEARFPDPPPDIVEKAKHFLARHHALSTG
jgi:acyl dehydratase